MSTRAKYLPPSKRVNSAQHPGVLTEKIYPPIEQKNQKMLSTLTSQPLKISNVKSVANIIMKADIQIPLILNRQNRIHLFHLSTPLESYNRSFKNRFLLNYQDQLLYLFERYIIPYCQEKNITTPRFEDFCKLSFKYTKQS